MPYLRFSRDERGYENTYVLHTYRRDGRSEPRLLYWFRTPPNVKVGRLPLNADAIRAIEESNPDLSFDWTKMLKVKPPPAPRERGERRARTSSKAGSVTRGRRTGGRQRGATVPEESRPVDVREDVRPEEVAESVAAPAEAGPAETELRSDEVEPLLGDDDDDEAEDVEVEGQHPVVALMGDEALARIRARYAEIQVRITEKFEDPSAGEEIRARAEGLNPDRWATIEEAVRGIETFEAEAEAIRAVLGRRRPRSRRGGGRTPAGQSGPDDVQMS